MNALVIGGGGREHALVWKLAHSRRIDKIFAAPGNPGTARIATNLKPADQTPQAYVDLAASVDAGLTVVGPEAPLVAGVVDAFRAAGRRIIGPTRAAAQLEGSKAFTKDFLLEHGIPTARSHTAESAEAATTLLDAFGFPIVLKADGLAAGKGVIIAQDRQEATAALKRLPPGRVVVEEFLSGEEVSFIVLADAERALPMMPTQDHKAIYDGDLGPNTGGMGAYTDSLILNELQIADIMQHIIHPTLAGMISRGTPYTGFLYAGLMMTDTGPKVLEYNCRLGDPETQPLMTAMTSDLGDVFLDTAPFTWRKEPSVCVVLAASGYPGTVRTGDAISGIEAGEALGAMVFHAGTRVGKSGEIETAGGRVLGVTASGAKLTDAIRNAYAAVSQVQFDGMQYRTDIGRKGLARHRSTQ
ncbi:MAG: phosphoribosylamine--glycine ligase [Bryobacteraceae bacterium]